MKATVRSTFMRLAMMAAAIALLLRAILFERADLLYAVGILAAATAYEALYHAASHAIRASYTARAASSA